MKPTYDKLGGSGDRVEYNHLKTIPFKMPSDEYLTAYIKKYIRS